MAERWIKWVCGLPKKPEIAGIARLLKVTRHHAAALCMDFWDWVDENTRDGFIPHVDGPFIDDVVHTKGFTGAMVAVEWLSQEANGFRIPNFDHNNGETAKARAGAARRMAKMRDGNVTARASPKAQPDKREIRGDTGVPANSPPSALTPIRQQPPKTWVDGLITDLIGAFELPDNLAEQQRRSFASVGHSISKRPDREELATEFIKWACELRNGNHDKPVKKWQGQVNERLSRNES